MSTLAGQLAVGWSLVVHWAGLGASGHDVRHRGGQKAGFLQAVPFSRNTDGTDGRGLRGSGKRPMYFTRHLTALFCYL